jgi:hypothetical protein
MSKNILLVITILYVRQAVVDIIIFSKSEGENIPVTGRGDT